jgi:hypothetical protein
MGSNLMSESAGRRVAAERARASDRYHVATRASKAGMPMQACAPSSPAPSPPFALGGSSSSEGTAQRELAEQDDKHTAHGTVRHPQHPHAFIGPVLRHWPSRRHRGK